MVIGCPGSGKSTLAMRLGEKLTIPVHNLDDWQDLPFEEFIRVQNELTKEDKWILDGNFTKSIDNRATKADTVIFLDLSRWVVCWRVFKRYVVDFKNITENFSNTLGIFKYVWKFPRMEILSILEKHKEGKRILILHNQAEVRTLLRVSS